MKSETLEMAMDLMAAEIRDLRWQVEDERKQKRACYTKLAEYDQQIIDREDQIASMQEEIERHLKLRAEDDKRMLILEARERELDGACDDRDMRIASLEIGIIDRDERIAELEAELKIARDKELDRIEVPKVMASAMDDMEIMTDEERNDRRQ